MPAYSGKYTGEGAGACRLEFDDERCTVTPPAGRAIAFDLGDIDAIAAGEWELELALHTGQRISLHHFGPAFSRMASELSAAWRDRAVRCLLLEDLEELKRFQGYAQGTPAEVRIYKSNVAVLPQTGVPFQWRLADVDCISFDPESYAITLQSGAERLVLSKFAKKTDECAATLKEAHEALRERSARTLHRLFPFLDPDRLDRLQAAMPEGRSAPLKALAAIHPKLPEAVIARAVNEPLRPYFDALRSRAAADALMTGFKFIRPDEEDEEGEEQPPEEGVFFWFFCSEQEFDMVAILCGFLQDDEFGLGHGHALRLQQQVSKVGVPTPATE